MFRVVRSLAKTTPKLIGQSKKNTTSLAVGKKVNAQQTKQFSVEKVEVIETIPMSQATIEREGETMKQFFDLCKCLKCSFSFRIMITMLTNKKKNSLKWIYGDSF